MRFLLTLLAAAPLVSIVGCEKSATEKSGASAVATADGRCPHEIKPEKCPFCTPALIESQGFCGEHGVAEALCYQCRPFLKTAFRAKGDWCKTHDAPDSQCVLCHPELKERAKPGSGHGSAGSLSGTTTVAGACAHGIDPSNCPFCKPGLIESDGFCKEHDVAEALCVKCRPYLVTAFKTKNDWCAEHETPESQCAQCNPSLEDHRKP